LKKKKEKNWFKENWSREKNRKKTGPEKKRERNDEQNKRGARRVSRAFNLYIYSISRVALASKRFFGGTIAPHPPKKTTHNTHASSNSNQ
jgi:hypothetical protein